MGEGGMLWAAKPVPRAPFPSREEPLKGTARHACPVVARGIKGCILIDCASSRQTPHHSLPQPHSNVTQLMY